MDPLSVTASIIGISTAAAKIISVLTEYIRREKDAPRSMRTALTELSDLTLCLSQLQPFIQATKVAPQARRDAISVEQIIAISTSLVLNVSDLEKMLDSFRLQKSMSTAQRLHWARSEGKLNKRLICIEAFKNSLNLILTIFTW